MKNHLIIAILASLSFACERKEVTINPPGETKETTIVTPAPAPAEKTIEKKTETETTITPDGTTTEKTETTEER